MTRVSDGVDEVVGRGKQVGFVGVSDLDAAERFYGGVLGLDLIDARPFALVRDTPASHLLITAVDEVHAAPYTVLGWIVADLEGEMDRLAATGVSFTRYDGMVQDDRGIWTAPDGARVAWFHDPRTPDACACPFGIGHVAFSLPGPRFTQGRFPHRLRSSVG
ncbi:MAG: VOC family protein [Dermatophilaceae bacterium]